MIHLKVWCPFERIASQFVELAARSGVKSLTICFDGFGERTLDVTTVNKALQFSVDERLNFISEERRTGSIIFDGVSRQFIVYHDIFTSYPPPRKAVYKDETGKQLTVTNGDVDGVEVCYPEAVHYNLASSSNASFKPKEQSELRPFYNYVYYGTVDKVHIFHGPGILPTKRKVDILEAGGVKFPIYGDFLLLEDKVVTPEPSLAATEKAEIEEITYPKTVILEPAGLPPVKFVISQTVLIHGQYFVSFEAIFKIWSIAIYAESGGDVLMDEKNQIHIPLRLSSANQWVLDDKWNKFYNDFVVINPFVSEIMSPYLYDRDSLLIRNPRTDVPLCVSSVYSTSACYALCFAVMLVQSRSDAYTSVATVLWSLLNNSFIVDANELASSNKHFLHGNSKLYLKPTTVDVKFGDKVGSLTNFYRKDLKLDNAHDGYAILGFDPFGNRFEGEPDHYIVVKVLNNRLYVVFDPYKNKKKMFEFRQEVTSYYYTKEAVLWTFSGTLSIGGDEHELREFLAY